MIKLTAVALMTAALLSASAVFANENSDAACCAKTASNKAMWTDFASMKLTAAQKTKLEKWQADCMKAGCTKESRTAFLKKAEGVLSKDQYATLKAQCDKSAAATKTQT
jgi:hypothetical protein